jgi:hypothetical protein
MACRALLVNGTSMWFAACRGPSDVLGLGSHDPWLPVVLCLCIKGISCLREFVDTDCFML